MSTCTSQAGRKNFSFRRTGQVFDSDFGTLLNAALVIDNQLWGLTWLCVGFSHLPFIMEPLLHFFNGLPDAFQGSCFLLTLPGSNHKLNDAWFQP